MTSFGGRHARDRVDRVLDPGWLRCEMVDPNANGIGRPGIDPKTALQLMLTGFPLGIVHDPRLMRKAQVNLAIRWFAGFGLNGRLPDHSSLTRIRQWWGRIGSDESLSAGYWPAPRR